MGLFCAKDFQNFSYAFLKLSFKLGNTSCILPEQPGQLYGITKRIYLKLSLPHPGILIRIVLFPAGAAWRRIKSIGVRIDTNILKLALYQTCYNFPDLPVFLCQENVRTKLRR